ncbi:hypothetical protein A7M79_07185 [Acinetobacter baumannii]|uniref:DotH/IcmK family type IV secretion protein n=1 Tax=Acinetobacter baumannii TaxID=470 RepID=UPI0008DEA068|nr:DotH/IcmK family type IV secretion protein [Acinetobacter baumannii]OIH08590.1 hypothetical protein A7M79_07185 [Acinetobacter baumannii]
MKYKLSFLFLAVSAFSPVHVFADDAEQKSNPYASINPEYIGSSYDAAVENEKRLNELKALEFTQDQTNMLKDMILRQKRNLSTPYTNTAKPITRSIPIKFDAGLTPQVLRLSANILTTVVFTDSVGNPWNIASVSLNRNLFSDSSDVTGASSKDGETTSRFHNILTLEPLDPVASGNVVITLEGLDKPVIFMLSTGQNDVDTRVDARISGLNPNKKMRAVNGGYGQSSSGNTLLDMDETTLLFVDGNPPVEAERIKTSSPQIEAWSFNDQLVVRTNKEILYPPFISSAMSSGGITVYRFDIENQSITIRNGSSPETIFIEHD